MFKIVAMDALFISLFINVPVRHIMQPVSDDISTQVKTGYEPVNLWLRVYLPVSPVRSQF